MAKKKKDEAEIEISANGSEPIIVTAESLERAAKSIYTKNESSIAIKKASITKDSMLKIEYTDHTPDGNSRDIGMKCDAIVHADLKAAFNELVPHAIILCDQKDDATAYNHLNEVIEGQNQEWNDLDEYRVTGFSVGNSDNGVCLICQKELGGKVLNLISPFELWDTSEYQYSQLLQKALAICKEEVTSYLNGKGGFKQEKLDFPDSDIAEVPFENEAATDIM